jgi:hypothetical protein
MARTIYSIWLLEILDAPVFNLALGDTCLVSINCIVLCKTYEIIMKNTSIAINGKGFLNSPLLDHV